MDLDVGSNPRIAVKIPNIKERRPAMSSGWWMTELLGLQDHVALSSPPGPIERFLAKNIPLQAS
jgi:hypothetical protein